MALEWPDFSQATITDAKTVDALKFAVAERAAAARAGNGYSGYTADGWFDPTPDLHRIRTLRDAIRGLAQFFVRLEDERYKWQAWSRFPISYSGNDLMKGEHSLAILPAPATPEADSARLEDYRRFLENCAWWLKQFRYVSVADQSFYTRKAAARGHKSISDYPWLGGHRHEESGEEPETYLASPEISGTGTDSPPNASRYMIRCYHWDSDRWEDTFAGREKGWQYDTDRYQWREVEATAYSGLVVRNFSGLAGSLILVPCYERSTQGICPERRIETYLDEDLMPTSPTDDDGDRMTSHIVSTETREDRHDLTWLETYRRVEDIRQWWEPVDGGYHSLESEGTVVQTETNWSLDGSRSFATTSTKPSTHWKDFLVWERTDTYIDDFDGFGEWELGMQVPGGIVPAHGRVVAIPERDDIPPPDVWDLTGFRKWRVSLHPRDRDDDVHYTAYLRISPILDFNSSYQYQDN